MTAGRCVARLAVAGLLPLIAACATVSAQRLESGAAQTVGARIDQPVKWNTGTPDEQRVHDTVRGMLADELTLDESVAIALVNNREMRAAIARAGVVRAELVQAGLLDNPVFGFSLLSGNGIERRFSVIEDFLSVFTLSARKKLAAGELERAHLQLAQHALDLAAEVKHTYYALVADRQAIELYAQVLDATEAAAELARRQFDTGTLSRREQAMHQAFYAQAALQGARAEAQFASDREKLNRQLGLWGQDTGWKLPQRLPDVANTVPAAATLEQQAITQRLDLAARRAEVETVHMALDYTKQTRWLASLGIGFTVKRDTDGSYLRGPNLELGLPLFDGGQGRIARLEAQLQNAEARYAQLAIDIRAEVRDASTRLTASHELLRHYREAILPLNERIVDETLKFYNGMLVGVYDLLVAKQAQISAARDYIGTLRGFWEAWVDLERALGKNLPRRGADKPTPEATPTQPTDQTEHKHGEQ